MEKTGFTAYDNDSRVIFIFFFNSFPFVDKGGNEGNVFSPSFLEVKSKPSSAYCKRESMQLQWGSSIHNRSPFHLCFTFTISLSRTTAVIACKRVTSVPLKKVERR